MRRAVEAVREFLAEYVPWTAIDLLVWTTRGRAMILGFIAAIVGFFGHRSHDLLVVSVTVAVVCALVFIPISKPTKKKRGFVKLPASSNLGLLSDQFADVEHEWTQSEINYQEFQDSWNRYWLGIREILKKTNLSIDEQNQLMQAKKTKAAAAMITAGESLIVRLRKLEERLTALVGDD